MINMLFKIEKNIKPEDILCVNIFLQKQRYIKTYRRRQIEGNR